MTASNTTFAASLPGAFQQTLTRVTQSLVRNLGDNLQSLVLYGSAVRGNIDPATSDLNLLLVLELSSAEAHAAIADIVRERVRVDPMVIERSALDRAVHVFALKFLSMQRNYRVLHGLDPLESISVPPDLLSLLCEQELRNTRMRLAHAYIIAGRNAVYYRDYLVRNTARMLVGLSDAIRSAGIDLPHDLDQRPPIFAQTFNVDVAVLNELLAWKHHPPRPDPARLLDVHARLLDVYNRAIDWLETQCPTPPQ